MLILFQHFLNEKTKTLIFLLPLRIQIVEESRYVLLHDMTPPRSEPSSRIFLIGEQPNPWDLLQPQDKMSRHRGAELRRRYELLGGTSLLSLE